MLIMRIFDALRSTWHYLLKFMIIFAFIILIIPSENINPSSITSSTLAANTAYLRFNWVAWEVAAILEEVDWWLSSLSKSGASKLALTKTVHAFLERQWQLIKLERKITAEYARLPQDNYQPNELPTELIALESEFDELDVIQRQETPTVERILSNQISQILADEGFARPQMSNVFPPVTFRFSNPPSMMIVSPRHKIEVQNFFSLRPKLPVGERVQIESTAEASADISALVTNVGGVGTWPTMVMYHTNLPYLLDTIAHEWTHTYLWFKPLGLRYLDSRDLRTMNETVASIVGGEVADLTLMRYYPELYPTPTPLPSDVTPTATLMISYQQEETFYQAMRRIRLHVDDLLAQGQIKEAESYMETERQILVERGYNLRKLNQAYFAFHGSYAVSEDGVATVDPIGLWLHDLRQQSDSLKDFLEQAGEMTNVEDLLESLNE